MHVNLSRKFLNQLAQNQVKSPSFSRVFYRLKFTFNILLFGRSSLPTIITQELKVKISREKERKRNFLGLRLLSTIESENLP